MKISIINFLMLLLSAATTFGQALNIQFNSLNNYQFYIKNIWDLTIVNSSSRVNAVLVTEIKTKDQTQIFWSNTMPLTITTGLNRITSSSIAVDRMEYGVSNASDYLSQTGFLPEGNYIFEASILGSDAENKILAKNSVELNVQPIIPPVLISPFSGEKINTLSPTLTWLPPAPVAQKYLSYSLRLVEISENESLSSGIQMNIPLIDEKGLRKTSFIVKEGSNILQYDHHYAWQISAYIQDEHLATTEVWTFTPVKNKITADVIPGLSYWILTEVLDGGYNLTDDTLRVSYKNNTQETALNYQIINLNSPEKKIQELPPIIIKYGVNNIDIVLKNIKGLKYNESYLFAVTDSKKREYKMRFVYGNPKKRDWGDKGVRNVRKKN